MPIELTWTAQRRGKEKAREETIDICVYHRPYVRGSCSTCQSETHQPHFVGNAVNNPTDAAFRDGLFQGRLDAERGRRQHLAIGRWNVDADRRSFVSGYLHAYREMYARVASEPPRAWQLAEQRGFRDGIADGFQQGRESKRSQPAATESYKRANRGYSDSGGDLNQYKRLYREAYCTGYHQGYYGELEKIEVFSKWSYD